MKRIVILGGGFAGLAAARELRHRSKKRADLEVVLIDRNNFMAFTPLLPEAATGSVEVRDVTQPFRALLPGLRFELGEVLGVDESERTVRLQHPLTHETSAIGYDELVLAVGSVPSTLGIDGVERCTLPLRTVADAQRLRSRVLGAIEIAAETKDLVERDRLLRFVIVGGGFTGVEAAGELTAFLHAIVRYYPTLQEKMLRVVLVEAGPRLLPHLPERFGKYAARVLHRRGVEIRTGTEVDRVDPSGLSLKNGDRYASRTILWDAGNHPVPLVSRLGLPLSHSGAIKTERDFSVPGRPHLWAIGDCAAIPKAGGGEYAPLAQNATREGPLLARNVLARLRGKAPKPFTYTPLGQMASLGNRHAVAELPGGIMLRGLAAWLLWRTYYLGRVPSTGHRTRVALDWTLGLAFSPALARLPMIERGEASFEALGDRERTS
jgi:NADH dehydrogenase